MMRQITTGSSNGHTPRFGAATLGPALDFIFRGSSGGDCPLPELS
jgi:hypothetical protein